MTDFDELDRLTSPEAASDASRSNFRPPFTAVTCDTGSLSEIETRYTAKGFALRTIHLELKNMRDIVGDYTGTDYQLEILIPDKPSADKEPTLMLTSAGKSSLRDLQNLKGVRLEERVHKYTGPLQVDGQWTDSAKETRYYHVVSIGSGSAASQAPVALPPELIAAAQQVRDTAPDEATFKATVMKDPYVLGAGTPETLAALMKQVMNGSFSKEPASAGA